MPFLLYLGMVLPSAYHLKLQAQGRLVVPMDVRAELGVKEGDEVILLRDEGGYRLTSRSLLAQSLLGVLQKEGEPSSRDLTQELLDDRREEAARKGW